MARRSRASEQDRRSAGDARDDSGFRLFRDWLFEGPVPATVVRVVGPPFDLVSMFKALILQAQRYLSDASMKFMNRGRLS